MGLVYREAEWSEAAGHRPLKDMDANQIVTLHRHFIWAGQQRAHIYGAVPASRSPELEGNAFYVSELFTAWFLWAALLWTVIEGFNDRRVDLRGQLAADIDSLSDALRRCRNAVFHVPKKPHDDRYLALMRLPDAQVVMERVSGGIGRLFTDEAKARGLGLADD